MTTDLGATRKTPIRFAVVGCGNIGGRHLAIIDSLDGAAIAGLCDIDPAKRSQYSDIYPDVPIFDSLNEMISGCNADIVNICTPHYLHAEQALAVINARRHVLVEKPMCLTIEDADRMIEAADKAGVLLLVVKQNRHNIPVALLREALDSKRLGKILMAQCNVIWNRYPGYYSQSPWLGRKKYEGGTLFTQVSHFIDLLIWICGDVVDAGGRIETKTHEIETEDCGTAWLSFSCGASGTLLWTTCAYNRNVEGSITVIGERGTVKIGGQYLNKLEHWDVEGYPLPSDIDWVDRPNAYGKYQGSSSNHDKVLRDVIRRVNREDVSCVSGVEARKTVCAIDLIYKHCRFGPK